MMESLTGCAVTPEVFNAFLGVMAVLAVIVFVALHFVTAGYGVMYTKKWGPAVNNKAGWVLMEAPVFVAMCLLWWYSDRRFSTVPLLIFLMFQLHYFQRSFIFPLLIKGKSKMPLTIILCGVLFNTLNALMQGGWIFYVSPSEQYTLAWLTTPQFIVGTVMFFAGMVINLHSDHIVRNLRKPGDTKHYIPRGGMYKYVSSANYFGEWVEWTGFAVLTWSWAGVLFSVWTFANLAPRAKKLHERYKAEFGEEFTSLKLKKMIPFIY